MALSNLPDPKTQQISQPSESPIGTNPSEGGDDSGNTENGGNGTAEVMDHEKTV